MTVRITKVYQENNKLTSTFLTDGEILANYFSSIQNGKAVQGVTEFIQHFGVAVERYLDETGEFILSGHVTIPGANFTVGKKVAANKYGYIGTIDKLESGSVDRIGGNIYIIGFALTTDTFLLQIDHTKPLLAFLIEGKRYMSELFNAVVYKETSVDFPAVCVSLLHEGDTKSVTLNATNWPTLVPALRSATWKESGGTPNIAYTSFSPGTATVITLDPAKSASNAELLLAITTSVRYFNNLEIDTALTGTHYLNLNLTLNFKGNDCRIVDVDLILQTITVDCDTTALTTDTGNIQIYPHRLPSIIGLTTLPDNLTKAQFRKLKQETTLSAGYAPSKLLTDRFQGHKHNVAALGYSGGSVNSGSIPADWTAGVASSDPVSDGTNGTPRTGQTTRGNLVTTYVYLYGGQYVA